jgi:hypothetical protein
MTKLRVMLALVERKLLCAISPPSLFAIILRLHMGDDLHGSVLSYTGVLSAVNMLRFFV